VPLEFDFILYKHGPFSFDLREQAQQAVQEVDGIRQEAADLFWLSFPFLRLFRR